MKMLLWAFAGIVSHGAIVQTCSSAAGNGKEMQADTILKGWRTKEDKYIAQRLAERLDVLIDSVQGNLTADSLNLGRPGRKGYGGKLAKEKEDSETLGLLHASRYELQQIIANKTNCSFIFLNTPYTVGGTCRDPDNVITIHYNSDENAIHELAHAWQIYEGKITGFCGGMNDTALYENELVAYKRQYAYYPNAFNKTDPSYSHTVQKITDIDGNWVLGLQDEKGDFVYMYNVRSHFPNIKTPDDWKHYLDSVYHRKPPIPPPQ